MDGSQTPETVAMNRFYFVQSLINQKVFPVNLSKDLSVNLANVTHFAPVELLDDKGNPKGEYAPGVYLISGEIILLTDEQKKEFTKIWNLYTMANAELAANLNAQYPTALPEQLQEKN